MPADLHVLSAGAARGVLLSLQPRLADVTLHASFGAVGAMRERWRGGAPCDVIVLTATLIDEMAGAGEVDAATRTSVGIVRTGVAVRTGDPLPPIGDADGLRAAMLACSGLYLPDPQRATAGIHCVDVLRRLAILDALQPRLRAHANGAEAMAALARAAEQSPLGCTQVSEILYTPGVSLAGPLPGGFGLATEYVAAVTRRAGDRGAAARLVAFLGGEQTRRDRREAGFEPR